MNFEFFPEVKEELIEAALEYEEKQSGLGWRFRQEIGQVIDWIVEHLFVLRERACGYRWLNCPVFQPYVAYIVRGETIFIVAVAHGRRFPDFWRARLREF